MKQIEVLCPAAYSSGGPELLHQFCFETRKLGFSAEMLYIGNADTLKKPVAHQYVHYNNPYTISFDDSKDKVYVVPETLPRVLKKIKKGTIVYWWLSVDNYIASQYSIFGLNMSKSLIAPLVRITKIAMGKTDDVLRYNVINHLVQSYYAYDFCLNNGIDRNKIMYLSDYINDDYINSSRDNEKYKKKNQVLYNPKKGIEFTKKIIKRGNGIKWIPIINMSYNEVAKLMKQSKAYIDFGNHPGKDRLPREAAINGCCVITDRRGSAAFSQDVPIPDEYKFEDTDDNIPQIVDKINDTLSNYNNKKHDFDEYRNKILAEHQQFISDLSKVCSAITR